MSVIIAVHPVGADENWADPYALNRPGQRHHAGHPWPPPHGDDPGTGRVVWDSAQRGGSRVRADLRQWRPAALRWQRLPAAVVPPTRSTARPLAEPDWLHHGPPRVHPPADGRGRAQRPDAAASPNQSPQTTRTATADPLVLDVWWSARSGP